MEESKNYEAPSVFGIKQGGTALFLIDPQNDFHEGGSLAVPGSSQDASRIAGMINAHLDDISQIAVTLDSHHKLHIANPYFWVNAKNERPSPFTLITHDDVEAGTWAPSRPELLEHCKNYTKMLEENKRFVLCVWPEHCLIGTAGSNVVAEVDQALQQWAGHNLDTIQYIHKGSNALTEMYSGLKADVIVPSDCSTHLNTKLISRLLQADRVLVCGQALSHCVNFTLRDLADAWPKDRMKDLVLLEDGASSVPSFEEAGAKLITDMKARGLTVCKVADAF